MLLSVSSPPTPAPETGWPNRHLEVEGSTGLEEVEDGGGGGGGGLMGVVDGGRKRIVLISNGATSGSDFSDSGVRLSPTCSAEQVRISSLHWYCRTV